MSRHPSIFLLPFGALLSTAAAAQSLAVRVVDGNDAPLGLTSVVIRPLADTSAVMRRLTNASGALQQPVAAGQYVVIARRVGFRADSTLVRSDSVGAITVTLRLQQIPQVLAAMVVRESADCSVTAGGADADGSLWDEIVKGIEARSLIEQNYRFERRVRRVVRQDPSMGRTRERIRDTAEVNDPAAPDSGVRYRSGGYTARSGNKVNIRLFTETDLTQESFTHFHCHGAPWRDSVDGSVRIAFAPRQGLRGAESENRVRGMIVMDGTTWRMRRVTYEYVRDGKSVGHGSLEYAPMAVDGSVFAMPIKAVGDLALRGRFGLSSQLASWTIDLSYGAFSRVGERPPI
jgi:hypothetical protein